MARRSRARAARASLAIAGENLAMKPASCLAGDAGAEVGGTPHSIPWRARWRPLCWPARLWKREAGERPREGGVGKRPVQLAAGDRQREGGAPLEARAHRRHE